MGIVGTVSLIGLVGFVLILLFLTVHCSEKVKKTYKWLMLLAIAVLALNLFVVVPSSLGVVITENTSHPEYKYNSDGSIKHKSNGDYDIQYNFGEEIVGREPPSSGAARMSWILLLLGVGIGAYALMSVSANGSELLRQASLKLRESAVMHKVYPYAKWVMYACELFFLLSIFWRHNIPGISSLLCNFILVASFLALYAVKNDRHFFMAQTFILA